MNSSGHKTSKLVPVLVTGVCLLASGSYAADSSTAKTAPKPGAQSSASSTHATTTHPAAKKPGPSTTTLHSTASPKKAAHPGSTHHTATKTTAHASSAQATKSTPNHLTANAGQHKGTTTRKRRTRTLSGQQRLARLHLQPDRVQEIQQALIREGYLQGDANGQWDSRTHEAMQRYQTDHGFPATGLPEAKSLMKLGLGAHPLPAELDHGAVGSATPTAAPGDLNVTPTSPPVSQATPPS